MGIVWARPLSLSTVPEPKYTLPFWRPPRVNGVRFAALDSSAICRLSAIIARCVPYDTIRYILGATGEGSRQLREDPALPISWVDYVFIYSDEGVTAWLLSNPVLKDPLDLLVYCHRVPGNNRPVTPPLRRHNYLAENAVANWARDAGAPRGGAPQPGTRAEAGEQQAQETPDPSFSTSFGAPSDVSGAMEGGDGSVSQLPSPSGDRSESPTNRIPLSVKSLSLLNIQQSSELRRRPPLGNKRRAQVDDENSDVPKSKRPYLGYVAREVLGYEEARKEVRKREPHFDNEVCDLPKSERVRSSLVGRVGVSKATRR